MRQLALCSVCFDSRVAHIWCPSWLKIPVNYAETARASSRASAKATDPIWPAKRTNLANGGPTGVGPSTAPENAQVIAREIARCPYCTECSLAKLRPFSLASFRSPMRLRAPARFRLHVVFNRLQASRAADAERLKTLRQRRGA
jgi:hypothetical protein